jgi:hypothetical protein
MSSAYSPSALRAAVDECHLTGGAIKWHSRSILTRDKSREPPEFPFKFVNNRIEISF